MEVSEVAEVNEVIDLIDVGDGELGASLSANNLLVECGRPFV